jgi:hypothetical protein
MNSPNPKTDWIAIAIGAFAILVLIFIGRPADAADARSASAAPQAVCSTLDAR